jgi:carbohydrate kinase (thermoresistant glucokinase family)
MRDDDELDWNYLRVPKSLEPFIRWEKQGGDLFELVVLEGWPSKVATNQDDGSYATKDLFSRHPTKRNCFKWSGRLDDTLVLLNGEKAIPIPIEHTTRENPFVAEVVVFGAGRPQLGMIVVPSPKTEGIPESEVLAKIIPSVEAANADQPAYAQVAQDMIRILPLGTQYPRTDKDTVIRAAFYNQFKELIEQIYADQLQQCVGGGKDFTRDELRVFLRNTILEVLKLEDSNLLADDTDFFALGLDSLQALRAHNAIVKTYNTNGRAVSQNVVFEHPTLNALTNYLHCLHTGESQLKVTPQETMQRLVEKYSTFKPHVGTLDQPGTAAVVTGATGSLGAHVVARLVRDPAIQRVYCLVRASSVESAQLRVISSMKERRVYHVLPLLQRRKILAIPSDFGKTDLALSSKMYQRLLMEVGIVIHLAWAVNFNMGIESFEKQHIAGAHNLLQFCLNSKRSTPAAFHFGSSVSAVAASPTKVEESTETDFTRAQTMGYAQSKLVTENICSRAAKQTGMISRVHRIGQVIGDTEHGIWNETEAIPLIVQAAVTVGCVPTLDETPNWLPVDVVAQSVVDLSLLSSESVAVDSVFHIVNPTTFHWTRDFIPALKSAGLKFDEVPQREWIRRLRNSNPDAVANPPFKLVEFFAGKYDRDDKRSALYYKTDLACSHSPILHRAHPITSNLVAKFVKHWQMHCWSPPTRSAEVLIVAGPCGTGKTTIAEALSAAFGFPCIEADSLHSEEAIAKMASGAALADEDRWDWLEKIKRRFIGKAVNSAGVIVTCSALKKAYRDKLRDVPSDIGVTFLMLQGGAETLTGRVESRTGHYMKKEMVEGQVSSVEEVGVEEFDVIPLDVERTKDIVVRDAVAIAQNMVFRKQ